jgi:hypothetical protein
MPASFGSEVRAAWLWIALLLPVTLALPERQVRAEEVATGERGKGPDFDLEFAPILIQYCLECHHDAKASGGLDLTRRNTTLHGGDSGPAVVPGEPGESYLLERVRLGEMPPARDQQHAGDDGPARLSPGQVAMLEQWIVAGARWPEDRILGLHERAVDLEEGRSFWAFQPVRRPPVPLETNSSPPANPIDCFLEAKLTEAGLTPNPPAEPHELLRRASLTLIGLPPTLGQQEAFRADNAPDAWDQLVTRLLAHPGYGERWGRHWLDLARYADSNGYERDGSKPNVYRYRDYVIRSLNQDKAYDRFVLEQIAGDELPGADAESMLGLGFHALGTWQDEVDPLEAPQYRADELDDLVRTTVQTFLGLTIGCARCHHHKFDPLTMVDYYSLSAILAPFKRPNQGRTDRDLPLGTREELALLARRDARIAEHQRQIKELSEELTLLEAEQSSRSHETEKGVETGEDPASSAVERKKAERAFHDQQVEKLRRDTPDLPRGYVLFEPPPPVPPTYLLLSGRASRPGPEMEPRVPAVLTLKQPEFLPEDEHTSRRRLTLARWMVDIENPLTARVMVNRVWQHHFGTGLVATPSDFGQAGARPTHPELLDWLAHWFMHDAAWSVKRLHYLIMTSNAYRRSSAWQEEGSVIDPENRLLWRVPLRRLEVEPLRDSVLSVSGTLREEMYGPAIFLPIDEAAIEAHTDKQQAWSTSAAPDIYRRTIYAYIKRTLLVPMLEVLDLCDTTQSTDTRSVTSIAPQALTLYNGQFMNEQAEFFAQRLVRDVGDDFDEQIARAYQLALARQPREEERRQLRAFLASEIEGIRAEHREISEPSVARYLALVQMCRVLLNLNEFVYVP